MKPYKARPEIEKPNERSYQRNLIKPAAFGLLATITFVGALELQLQHDHDETLESSNDALEVQNTLDITDETNGNMLLVLINGRMDKEPICSNIQITTPVADVDFGDSMNSIIQDNTRTSNDNSTTRVSVCLEPNPVFTEYGDIQMFVTTDPKLREGEGQTSLYLSLDDDQVIQDCKSEVVKMRDAVYEIQDELLEITNHEKHEILIAIDESHSHPCDSINGEVES